MICWIVVVAIFDLNILAELFRVHVYRSLWDSFYGAGREPL